MHVFLCRWYASMRASCALCVCASILYAARVTVRLRAHERVCVARVCQVSASVYACVCGVVVCASYCMWCAYVRVKHNLLSVCVCVWEPYVDVSEAAKHSI